MLPEFRPAFEAWKKTDPLNNPEAPAGPQLMKEFHNSMTENAAKLNDQASEVFEQGNMARHHSDEYVRVTVTLATVLLLMAISQRFKVYGVRVALIGIRCASPVFSALSNVFASAGVDIGNQMRIARFPKVGANYVNVPCATSVVCAFLVKVPLSFHQRRFELTSRLPTSRSEPNDQTVTNQVV